MTLGVFETALVVQSIRVPKPSLLTVLDLSGNNFERVPASIKQLSKLKELLLNYCKRLQSLPNLRPYLQYLDAHDCTSLEAVSVAINFHTHTSCFSAFPITWYGQKQKFIFTNCINLDQKAILTKTQLHIQQMAIEHVKIYHQGYWPMSSLHICFPGREIWSGLTVKIWDCVTTLLPPYLHERKFVAFALCIVVAFDDWRDSSVECRCNFKINGDDYLNFCYFNSECLRFIGSDHVFLGYDFIMYCNWDDGESNYHLNEASFEFSICKPSGNRVDSCMVKKCGVRLLYGQGPHPPSESEDGTTTKRPCDDEPRGNIRSNEEEEPRLKRLK